MSKIVSTLQGKANRIPPAWLMRQAGRYLPEYQLLRKKLPTFMELCFHEDYATEVTLQPLQRFDFDAAILFSDILVIPHVLGQPVQFIEGRGPVLDPFDETTFFDRAKSVNLEHALATPLKILANVRQALPSTKAMIGFAGSPWTIATYMLEGGKSRTFSRIIHLLETQDPLFVQTMALLEEAVGTFLLAQIKAGADVVQIFDSWAKAVPSSCQKEWIVEPARRLISRIQAVYPATPLIYYGRGASALYPAIIEGFTNVAFGVDEEVSPEAMKAQCQNLAPVQGNLCPQLLKEGGEAMESAVRKLLQTFHQTPYVFNLGHGVIPQTPISHVERLMEMVKGGDDL